MRRASSRLHMRAKFVAAYNHQDFAVLIPPLRRVNSFISKAPQGKCLQMSFVPLINAVPPIPLHAFAAMAALVLGIVQLTAPKGTLPHRTLGWIWVVLMLIISASSFWIHGDSWRLWRTWSPIHLLSVFTPLMLFLGVFYARKHDIKGHRITMISIFTGALVIAGIFTLVPGRIMHVVVFGQ